jgi:hypothetical protein
MRFVQADLKQGLYVNRAMFDTSGGYKNLIKDQSNTALADLGGSACGIYAPDAIVGVLSSGNKLAK